MTDAAGTRLGVVERGPAVTLEVDGRPITAYAGETIAGALLSSGVVPFRLTREDGEPRSYYCGMGICFECLVRVDGVANVRACMTPVANGMRVQTVARRGEP